VREVGDRAPVVVVLVEVREVGDRAAEDRAAVVVQAEVREAADRAQEAAQGLRAAEEREQVGAEAAQEDLEAAAPSPENG
jgi:hypothetical protein